MRYLQKSAPSTEEFFLSVATRANRISINLPMVIIDAFGEKQGQRGVTEIFMLADCKMTAEELAEMIKEKVPGTRAQFYKLI